MSGKLIVINTNSIQLSSDSMNTLTILDSPATLVQNRGVVFQRFSYNGSISILIATGSRSSTNGVVILTSTNPADNNSWSITTNHSLMNHNVGTFAPVWNGSYWLMFSTNVVSNRINGVISKSINGTDWTIILDSLTINTTSIFLTHLIWTGNFWLGILENYTFIKSTDDGVNWSLIEKPNLNVNSIRYNGSHFIATGNKTGTSRILQSTDCIVWNDTTISSLPSSFYTNTNPPVWNGSYWLSPAGIGLLKSDSTGINWNFINTPTLFSFYPTRVVWNGLTWVGIASNGVFTSSDGENWNRQTSSLTFDPATVFNLLPPPSYVTVPAAPTGVTAVAGSGSVVVTWSAPSNSGSEITGYIVTPSVGSALTVGNVLTATVTGLTNGTAVTFTVTAVNNLGSSSPSAPSSSVTPASVPGSPTAVTAVAGTNSAILSWAAPSSNGGAPITGYTVRPSTGDAVTVGNVLTTTLTGLASGNTLTFTVVAINSTGTSLPSAASNPIIPASPIAGPPSAVLGVAGSPGVGSVTVTWSPPISNGGSPITGYKIICSPDNKKTYLAGPNARSLVITGLKNTVTLSFMVFAINTAGQSDSVELTSYPLPGVPKITAIRGASGVINLVWFAKPSHVASAITGYVVSLVSPLPAPATMIIPTPTVTATGGFVSISGLTNGGNYVFSVRSVSNIGQSAVGLSKAMIAARVPDMPTAFAGIKAVKSAGLSWTAPVNTGGLPITGYLISYTVAGVAKVLSVKLVNSAIVKGLVDGTAYNFTIKAVNLIGSSVATESVSVTPGPGL